MLKKAIMNVKQGENIIKINLNKNCDLKTFYNLILNCFEEEKADKLMKPFNTFYLSVKRGVIYLIEKDNKTFNVYLNDEKIYISETTRIKDYIKETIMVSYNNKFSLISTISNLEDKALILKTYVPDNEEINEFCYCKKEAYYEAYKLLKNLGEFIDVEPIYSILNLIPNAKYNPVISDGVVSLSLSNKEAVKLSNQRLSQAFDIVLNDTKEKVGNISFNYNRDVKSEDSIGNVIYEVFDQYQNNGYCTRALSLLKKFVKNVEFNGDKDLYFWIWHDNEASKKVVLHNGGEEIEEERYMEKQPYTYRIRIEKS